MKHFEKKYRVDSFEDIEKRLRSLQAGPLDESTSTHYYGQHTGKDVVKLVVHKSKQEIYILDEADGKFSLRENIPVESKTAGLEWFKSKGFDVVSEVKMAHTDYSFRGGMIGLYIINDFLKSVILDFPQQDHRAIEAQLGLGNAEVISVPYDVYLAQLGQAKTLALD